MLLCLRPACGCNKWQRMVSLLPPRCITFPGNRATKSQMIELPNNCMPAPVPARSLHDLLCRKILIKCVVGYVPELTFRLNTVGVRCVVP